MELNDRSPSKRVTINPIGRQQLTITEERNKSNPKQQQQQQQHYYHDTHHRDHLPEEFLSQETLDEREEFYKNYPIDLIQDSVTIDDQSYIRRMFVRRTQALSNASAPIQNNCQFNLTKFEQSNIFYHLQTVLVAENLRHEREEAIAIRIKTGLSGYTQWMNELQVYLLPNFMHENILNFFGDDIDARNKIPHLKVTSTHPNNPNNSNNNNNADRYRPSPMKIQYWLLNNFHNCILLRDFLKYYTITWHQMISIAQGITQGLHYLHEQSDYQSGISKSKIIDGFVRSTGGAIKKVAFQEQRSAIYMKPHYSLSVIHRNLSTLTIVIRLSDLVPRIWDFAHSYIYHPFQPINGKQSVDVQTRELFTTSQYSPPEVLQEKAYLTLTSMKSIDMYAVGVIFWELISRCILPVLNNATEQEHYERANPEDYSEPFQLEFGLYPNRQILQHAVCKMRARPIIKPLWIIGKKTNRFVQTIQDLWDHDFDARIHTTTLLDRLERLSRSNRDLRNKYSARVSIVFNKATMWPPAYRSSQAPPFPGKCGPNLVFEGSSKSSSEGNTNDYYAHDNTNSYTTNSAATWPKMDETIGQGPTPSASYLNTPSYLYDATPSTSFHPSPSASFHPTPSGSLYTQTNTTSSRPSPSSTYQATAPFQFYAQKPAPDTIQEVVDSNSQEIASSLFGRESMMFAQTSPRSYTSHPIPRLEKTKSAPTSSSTNIHLPTAGPSTSQSTTTGAGPAPSTSQATTATGTSSGTRARKLGKSGQSTIAGAILDKFGDYLDDFDDDSD